MINIAYTYHAEARMQQRGISNKDIELILKYGTQVDEGTWLLRKRDVDRETRILKQQIQKLNCLENRKVVMRGKRIITAYRSHPADQKRMLRHGRQKGLVK